MKKPKFDPDFERIFDEIHGGADDNGTGKDKTQPTTSKDKRQPKSGEDKKNFIRVSDDYYQVFEEPRRFGPRTVIQHRKKQELRQDHGDYWLKDIKKFKKFITIPDNINYKREHGDFYNMYSPFNHQPTKGSADVTKMFLRHIFGEQYELGVEYLNVLYERPCQILPVLVMVSRARNTGKSTFFNWLSMLFGDNLVNVDPNDLSAQFNHIYATKNIITVDETIVEKTHTVERIKRISTQKEMTVNTKYVSQYTIDFYGKIILATNSETNFMRVDREEIRFWVRKLPTIPKDKLIVGIEDQLKKEIPAFLWMLKDRKWLYPKPLSRMHFPIDVLENEQLREVKEESRQWLYKELKEHLTNWFDNNPKSKEITILPKDLKKEFFNNDNRVTLTWIKKTLKEDYELNSCKVIRYEPTFGDHHLNKVLGRPWIIPRKIFIDDVDIDQDVATKGNMECRMSEVMDVWEKIFPEQGALSKGDLISAIVEGFHKADMPVSEETVKCRVDKFTDKYSFECKGIYYRVKISNKMYSLINKKDDGELPF